MRRRTVSALTPSAAAMVAGVPPRLARRTTRARSTRRAGAVRERASASTVASSPAVRSRKQTGGPRMARLPHSGEATIIPRNLPDEPLRMGDKTGFGALVDDGSTPRPRQPLGGGLAAPAVRTGEAEGRQAARARPGGAGRDHLR